MKKLKNNKKKLKKTISFRIFKGEKQYVAEGIDVPIVTQGRTLDELSKNVMEAVSLYLECLLERNKIYPKKPSIFMNFELPVGSA